MSYFKQNLILLISKCFTFILKEVLARGTNTHTLPMSPPVPTWRLEEGDGRAHLQRAAGKSDCFWELRQTCHYFICELWETQDLISTLRLRWQNSPLDKQQAKSGCPWCWISNAAGTHVRFSSVQPCALTATLLWAIIFLGFHQNSRTWGTFPKANCTQTSRFSCTV